MMCFQVGNLPHKEKERPILCSSLFSVTFRISLLKPQIYHLFPNPIIIPPPKPRSHFLHSSRFIFDSWGASPISSGAWRRGQWRLRPVRRWCSTTCWAGGWRGRRRTMARITAVRCRNWADRFAGEGFHGGRRRLRQRCWSRSWRCRRL